MGKGELIGMIATAIGRAQHEERRIEELKRMRDNPSTSKQYWDRYSGEIEDHHKRKQKYQKDVKELQEVFNRE
jgi:hypothetical protein